MDKRGQLIREKKNDEAELVLKELMGIGELIRRFKFK